MRPLKCEMLVTFFLHYVARILKDYLRDLPFGPCGLHSWLKKALVDRRLPH